MEEKSSPEHLVNLKKSPKGIHDGHRERLRNRYRESGLDSFEPHEVMELLLMFSIRRADVNERAHALIDRFGSVAGVLDASENDLCTVDGIGRETARFLSFLPDVLRVYAKSKCPPEGAMDTAAKICTYLQTLYIGVKEEVVYVLLFDNALRLLHCCKVATGTVNGVAVDVRTVIEQVIKWNAASVVLAHNHPNGLAFPSGEDRALTDTVSCALDLIHVQLLEHFVVTDTQCTSILRRCRGMLRAAPVSGEIDENFWYRFYGETRALS